MYRLGNVLTQSPEKVKVTVLAVGGVFVALFTDADPTLLETVGVGIAVERLLDLFYVAPQAKVNAETEALKAIDLGKQLVQPTVIYSGLSMSGGPGTVGNVPACPTTTEAPPLPTGRIPRPLRVTKDGEE